MTARIPVGDERAEALVDDGDLPLVEAVRWSLHTAGYAMTGSPTRYMHRLIMRAPKGLEVDHINGDKLDNRRQNLRLATRSQNEVNKTSRPNKSGFRGVTAMPCGTYRAYIVEQGRTRYLGRYHTASDAARAYDVEAIVLWGNFARLNLPERVNEAAPRTTGPARAYRSSGLRGVEARPGGRYRAHIYENGGKVALGSFASADAAAAAYDERARQLHGSNARLNFPNGAR